MPKTQREQARVLLAKADIDLRTAEVCFRHGEDADPVCFHVQQAAEKLLKAALLCAGISYPFTHSLGELLLMAVPFYPQLVRFEERLPDLTIYAITLRYDDTIPPDRQDAEEALALVRELREAVLAAL